MDTILYYTEQVYECLNEYQDIPFGMFMYEEAKADAIEKKNQGLIAKAIASLKNVYRTLIDACKNLFTKISTKLTTKAVLDEGKSEKYKEVKKLVNDDPEIANTEVEIDNYDEYEKVYNDAMKELDKAEGDEEFTAEEGNLIVDRFNEAMEALKSGGRRAITSVTLKTLVELADHSFVIAKALNLGIKTELIDLSQAEKDLGTKAIEKDKKKIERYARNGIIHRNKIRIQRLFGQTVGSIMLNRVNTIISFSNVSLDKNKKDGKVRVERRKKMFSKEDRSLFDKQSIARGAANNASLIHDTLDRPSAKDYIKAGQQLASTYLMHHHSKKERERFKKEINYLRGKK